MLNNKKKIGYGIIISVDFLLFFLGKMMDKNDTKDHHMLCLSHKSECIKKAVSMS